VRVSNHPELALMSLVCHSALYWRWTWYICTIWTFVQLVAVYLFVPETYAPKILRVKARRLRKETGNTKLRSRREQEEIDQNINIPRYVFLSIGRPFEILLKEPMALALCLWCALLLGILYAFFSAFVIIYSAKGLNEGQIGLTFLGMLFGILFATGTNCTIWPKIYSKTAARLGHKPPPEEHLKKAMVAAVLGPISLFWFAWTSQPSVHWAASVVSACAVLHRH
jgi:MFS family permease